MAQIKAVFGGGAFMSVGSFKTNELVAEALAALKKQGVTTIDTARLYTGSEELIGQAADRKDFIIDTKLVGGFAPGSIKKDAIIADTQDSIKRVQIDQFDILYIHSPDPTIPIEETLEGVQEVYKQGLFRRFGLSNFSAEQVQEVSDLAKSKGYVLPTVYQGNYNPVARKLETLLFPTLRKLNMVFYAYSPLAGGLLTKTKEQIIEGVGRFSDEALGGLYKKMYNKPSYLEALAQWNAIAEKEGVSKAELAYRWVGYHSALKAELGDAVIFGASSIKQLEQTAEALKKGKLSDEAAKGIQKVWEQVEEEAPIDNYIAMTS
ncbi:Aldo/keto reductase [Amniculicola lignicola CBS 123094]|uniref:Aldo/keto reductase n=1 Tax=Amniculicola lignicola CBS 123094 TaxID=1392246 RepID=A0A6A5W8B7_9PLEO|nr:Aldo/keto reductase [Amniculicola lignicola CBS 123094]